MAIPKLFTIVMEFNGGKYVSQVYATGVRAALNEWSKSLDESKIFGMGIKTKAELTCLVREETPVEYEGLRNAWSCLLHPRGKLCEVDIFLTRH